MAAPETLRSAAPLAAAGFACLGLVPLALGGSDRPLHWAVAGGLLVLSTLLWIGQRLGRRPSALARVETPAARSAGRSTLAVCAVTGALVAVIFGARLHGGGSIGLLSLSMPLISLVWLTSLGLKALRHREAVAEPSAASDRPSRRPPSWDGTASTKPAQNGSSNRHVSA